VLWFAFRPGAIKKPVRILANQPCMQFSVPHGLFLVSLPAIDNVVPDDVEQWQINHAKTTFMVPNRATYVIGLEEAYLTE